MQRTPIDLVNAIADSNVNFEEHEIKGDVEPSTLIVDKTKQTNDNIVVSEFMRPEMISKQVLKVYRRQIT